MSDFSFSKLTASLEELSLAKQLPLRQQVSKPILKYDTSVTKPVQLFKHADLSNFRHEGHSHGYGSIAQASSGSSMTPVRYRSNPPANHGLLTTKPGQTYMMSGSQEKTQNSKAHSNPYARPLSAKDIVNDLQSQKLKKSSSTSQMASHSTGSINMNNIISSSVPFHMNSFMRPQSAVRKDPKPKDPSSPTKADSKASSRPQASATEISSVTSINDKGNGLAIVDQADFEQNEDVDENSKPDEPNSACLNNSSKVPPKIATGHQIARTVNFKSIDKTSPQKSVVPNKVTSSIPRPGASAIVTKTVSSPEPPGKIRNLNYTPTKPFAEVDHTSDNKDVSVKSPQKSMRSKPPLPVSPHKPAQTSATNVCVTGGSSAVQMEKSKITATGTRYYRKGSKTEEKVHERRPPVIGAAKVARISEKPCVVHIINDNEEYSDTDNPGERYPGDGEASDDDFADEEGLEDDYFGSDGESDGISITSSLSRKSSSARIKSSRPGSRAISFSNSDENVAYHRPTAVSSLVRPAFNKSLFVSIPSTLNFAAEGEKIEQLPWEMRKFLKWRMSPITPNVVKSVLSKVGFRITKRNHDWMGCWGKHMKSPAFKAIREYQKLNHFPGSFQIGRKDRLWRNLLKMQVHFGKKEFGFFPQTFVLPADSKQLKRAWEDGGSKQKWIIKPPASARGIGIKVIHKWNQIPRKRPVIVQRYIARPYLINDSKFDLRLYVYVSCFDPLRIYVFEDGLARFASCKYSSAMKNLTNKFMHLTNYSVNKKNMDYQNNTDEQLCQGHKWGLKAMWSYLKRQGVNTIAIWDSIKDLVIKTIICSDNPVNSMIKANVRSRYCVHELFGFDILLDDNLKPWILEVNISPSLHSNSQLDINIKSPMIRDLFNIAGFRIPDKNDVSHAASGSGDFSSCIPSTDYCLDKRLFSQQLSPDEKSKHAYYCQKHQDEQVLQTILDTLTPSDIRILTESIDEDNRKGGFQRIFPTPNTHKYLHYFETPRYCNLLIDEYIQRFIRMEQRGIAMLYSYCKEKIHVQFPTESPAHQWSAPNMSLVSYRESRMPSAPIAHHKETEQGIKHSASTSQLLNVPKKSKTQQLKSLSQTNGSTGVMTNDIADKSNASLMTTAQTKLLSQTCSSIVASNDSADKNMSLMITARTTNAR